MKLASLLVPAFFLIVGCGSSGSGSAPAGSGAPATSGAPAATAAATSTAKPSGGKSVACKFCLGPDGTSQDCGISCKTDKDPECCAKWAEKTKDICAKITKAQCQEICDKDENPTACEIAKTMK